MLMRGDIHEGAVACQWWAFGAWLAAAFATARLVRATVQASTVAGAVAFLAFLATPWTIVVGTLAYNDIVPVGLLAAGWLLLRRAPGPRLDARSAAALGASAAGVGMSASFLSRAAVRTRKRCAAGRNSR